MWLSIVLCVLTVFWPQSVEPTAVLAGALFGLFLAAPFLLLNFGGRSLKSSAARWLVLLAMAAALCFWVLLFLSAFVLTDRIDAQAGLIFVFGPIYMVFGAIILLGVALVVDLVLKTTGS